MENKELISTITPTFNKNEKRMEIIKRLQSEEAQKARKLLETAMSHLEAHRIMKNSISRKMNGSGNSGNGKIE